MSGMPATVVGALRPPKICADGIPGAIAPGTLTGIFVAALLMVRLFAIGPVAWVCVGFSVTAPVVTGPVVAVVGPVVTGPVVTVTGPVDDDADEGPVDAEAPAEAPAEPPLLKFALSEFPFADDPDEALAPAFEPAIAVLSAKADPAAIANTTAAHNNLLFMSNSFLDEGGAFGTSKKFPGRERILFPGRCSLCGNYGKMKQHSPPVPAPAWPPELALVNEVTLPCETEVVDASLPVVEYELCQPCDA